MQNEYERGFRNGYERGVNAAQRAHLEYEQRLRSDLAWALAQLEQRNLPPQTAAYIVLLRQQYRLDLVGVEETRP